MKHRCVCPLFYGGKKNFLVHVLNILFNRAPHKVLLSLVRTPGRLKVSVTALVMKSSRVKNVSSPSTAIMSGKNGRKILQGQAVGKS